ncbi:MAG TPA: hypothetical protein VFY52_00865 [Thermoleophilaceae bacterium]|nr:hypothetical protein [Thermoleophilaceae bacterium]
MSPDPVTWTALDRSTYATASLAGDAFYVEPPSVQPGLTIGEYRRWREASGRRPARTRPSRVLAAGHTRRRHPIAAMMLLLAR